VQLARGILSAHPTVGLFGKLPAQGDFFRLHVADPAAQLLVAWLQEAIEPVYRARLPLPAGPVRFLFRAPPAESALAGVMVASVDRVGRAFPLCGFAPLPARALAGSFPALPAALGPFLDEVEALLGVASGFEGEALAARARDLAAPGVDELVAATELSRRAAAAEPASALAQRLFGDLPQGAAAYALTTLDAATRPVRSREPARAALALDCPAQQDVDRWAWLELVRRCLAWTAPPPFFWTAGEAGRLVVSLGAAGPAVLVHLCDPGRPGPKVWPLRTTQPAAIDAALRSAPAAALGVLDGGGSVEALVAAAAQA
jgi:type VI secretion system protein ImpM